MVTRADDGLIDRDHIVDRIYEVALEPSSLDGFIEFWHDNALAGSISLEEGGQPQNFDDLYGIHLDRAQTILQRDNLTWPNLTEHLKPFENLAAFVANRNLRVEALNSGAASVFGFQVGDTLGNADIPTEVCEALKEATEDVLRQAGVQERLVRIDLATKGGALLFRVTRLPGAQGECALALIVSTHFHWREAIGTILKDVFRLTNAEADIVRLLIDGRDIKAIADARNASEGTVRVQIKSITSKMNLRTQTDIVRLVMTLGEFPKGPEKQRKNSGAPELSRNWLEAEVWKPFRSVTVPDGRTVMYHDMGPVTGTPVLLTHMGSCMVRWPRHMVKQAFESNLRVICPIRAGYGHSDNLASDAGAISTARNDAVYLLKSLGIARLPLVAQGTDFPFAADLIASRPDLFSAFIGVGARPSLPSGEHVVGAGRWQRFFVSTARSAPGLVEFASRAVMSMCKRIGPEAMLRQLCKDSPSDLSLLSDDTVAPVLAANLSLMAGKDTNAARAFAKEYIEFQDNWTAQTNATSGIPMQIFLAEEDPTFDLSAIPVLEAAYPWMTFEVIPKAGLALIYQAPTRFIGEMARAARSVDPQ